jgi:nucleotide-binding universal stress UspA family protein
VAATIMAEADNPDEAYDLVVLGGTREPLMYQLARDSVPETVVRQCNCPLAMVHAAAGIRSWIKRWV